MNVFMVRFVVFLPFSSLCKS